MSAASRQRSVEAEVDVELEKVDPCGLGHMGEGTDAVGRHGLFAGG